MTNNDVIKTFITQTDIKLEIKNYYNYLCKVEQNKRLKGLRYLIYTPLRFTSFQGQPVDNWTYNGIEFVFVKDTVKKSTSYGYVQKDLHELAGKFTEKYWIRMLGKIQRNYLRKNNIVTNDKMIDIKVYHRHLLAYLYFTHLIEQNENIVNAQVLTDHMILCHTVKSNLKYYVSNVNLIKLHQQKLIELVHNIVTM